MKADLAAGREHLFNKNALVAVAFRPFVTKALYSDRSLNEMRYQLDQVFDGRPNPTIAFLGVFSSHPIAPFGTETLFDYGFLKTGNGGTQALPRYRLAKSGGFLDNITDWGLKQFQKAYGVNGVLAPGRLGGRTVVNEDEDKADSPGTEGSPASPREGEKKRGKLSLTKDDIFHYVYGVLHDPVYREKYAINLKREFPRIPFYANFWQWAAWGEALMALHVGYESVEPWPLKRFDTPDNKARAAGLAPKAMLKADKDNGVVRLDSETQLSGVPAEVWTYRLGNRSGVEWVLDQYKEKTPKDSTIREKFNTYRFADYKEKVIDLIGRVTRVSVETVAITEAMKAAKR